MIPKWLDAKGLAVDQNDESTGKWVAIGLAFALLTEFQLVLLSLFLLRERIADGTLPNDPMLILVALIAPVLTAFVMYKTYRLFRKVIVSKDHCDLIAALFSGMPIPERCQRLLSPRQRARLSLGLPRPPSRGQRVLFTIGIAFVQSICVLFLLLTVGRTLWDGSDASGSIWLVSQMATMIVFNHVVWRHYGRSVTAS